MDRYKDFLLYITGLGPFRASSPLFFRNGHIRGLSPIQTSRLRQKNLDSQTKGFSCPVGEKKPFHWRMRTVCFSGRVAINFKEINQAYMGHIDLHTRLFLELPSSQPWLLVSWRSRTMEQTKFVSQNCWNVKWKPAQCLNNSRMNVQILDFCPLPWPRPCIKSEDNKMDKWKD